MGFDLNNAWDSVKDGISETAKVAHKKTNEFHEKYVTKITPDFGKYGDAAKFAAEMVPGVSEYNAIKDGDWQAFAIAAGIDVTAIAVGAFTAGAGYAAVKGGTSVAKAGVKVAVKEVAEAGAKKAVKEVAEAGAEKAVKEVVEASAEKTVKEVAEATVEKTVKETVETGAEKAAKETVEAGAEKAMKETAETGTEKVAKESVEKTAKEGVEIVEKKGGSYTEVKKYSDGELHEVHHMPADSVTKFDRADGPAIRMDKMDHRQTASWGNSREAKMYRDEQQKLIDAGKIEEAFKMDVDDIVSKFGDKYDDAIKEAREYFEKMNW